MLNYTHYQYRPSASANWQHGVSHRIHENKCRYKKASNDGGRVPNVPGNFGRQANGFSGDYGGFGSALMQKKCNFSKVC